MVDIAEDSSARGESSSSEELEPDENRPQKRRGRKKNRPAEGATRSPLVPSTKTAEATPAKGGRTPLRTPGRRRFYHERNQPSIQSFLTPKKSELGTVSRNLHFEVNNEVNGSNAIYTQTQNSAILSPGDVDLETLLNSVTSSSGTAPFTPSLGEVTLGAPPSPPPSDTATSPQPSGSPTPSPSEAPADTADGNASRDSNGSRASTLYSTVPVGDGEMYLCSTAPPTVRPPTSPPGAPPSLPPPCDSTTAAAALNDDNAGADSDIEIVEVQPAKRRGADTSNDPIDPLSEKRIKLEPAESGDADTATNVRSVAADHSYSGTDQGPVAPAAAPVSASSAPQAAAAVGPPPGAAQEVPPPAPERAPPELVQEVLYTRDDGAEPSVSNASGASTPQLGTIRCSISSGSTRSSAVRVCVCVRERERERERQRPSIIVFAAG